MKILLIEDEEAVRRALERFLQGAGHEVRACGSLAEAEAAFKAFEPDLALSDIYLPDGSGLDFFPKMLALQPGLPVILMTGTKDVRLAVEAMKRGAEDYLTKPFEMEELKVALDKAAEKTGLKREVSALRRYQRELGSQDYLFLNDPAMQKVYEQVEQAAAVDKVTVLILGETGTGKQHIARMIHRLSPRYAKPFVELHCAALPENLLESELFGYEAGAFTDAKGRKKGLFETAQGGTVFLDEIGELPLSMQTKLLKVLEQKALRRLGGLENIPLDVRLVAATNRDLAAEVEAGRFRADFYYRINVSRISLPPLRERPQDIAELSRYFFAEACKEFGKRLPPLSEEMVRALAGLEWKGNVRELKNTVERMVLHSSGEALDLDDLPEEYAPEGAPAPAQGDLSAQDKEEKARIEALLLEHRWHKVKVAEALGVSKPTLFKRLKKYGLM